MVNGILIDIFAKKYTHEKNIDINFIFYNRFNW